jgi:hypothetical protein
VEEKVMALPQIVLDLLSEQARNNGAAPPQKGDDLFQTGALDSFALMGLCYFA